MPGRVFAAVLAVTVAGCAPEHAVTEQSQEPSHTPMVASPVRTASGTRACPAESRPDDPAVQAAIAAVPKLRDDLPWYVGASGQAGDCRLSWVLLSAHGTASTPDQLLFFDGRSYLGTATPQPHPYTEVIDSGQDTVTVRYRYIVGDEPNCCPAGQTSVRFRIGGDGHLEVLDPLPSK